MDFSRYVPEGFGTADIVIASDGTLRVVDYKFGERVRVSEDSPQLKLYALGALILFDGIYDIETVAMTVYQPRCNNIRTCTLSKEELYEWAEKTVKPAAERAYAGEGEYLSGSWCMFCKAKKDCEAYTEQKIKLARHDFQ